MEEKLSNFETRPCSRCGGNGRYSFTPMYGDTCFKCGGRAFVPGTGRVLSKWGNLAREAWLKANSIPVAVRDVLPGYVLLMGGLRKTVVAVETGSYGSSTSNGIVTEFDTALVFKGSETKHVYGGNTIVTQWSGLIKGPEAKPVNTDRKAEMQAYIKAVSSVAVS